MRSFYGGEMANGGRLHMIHYFDGQRIREIEVHTYDGIIQWTEKRVPGILEPRIKWTTAKQRLTTYEKRCSSRIG